MGRRRHTFERIIDRGKLRESLRVVVRHVHAVQSTIQREIGVTVVNMPFRVHQKAACGVIAHPIRVN